MPAIPDNLMERLHQATEAFRQARLRADGAGTMDNEQRQTVATALRAAEKELEDVTCEINALMPDAAGLNRAADDAQGDAGGANSPSN